MALLLTVASYQNRPPAQELSKRFDGTTVTIGRAPSNDWVLDDPDQHLSKRHCVVQMQGGRYFITDTSTNGVYLNDSPQPLGNGHTAPLNDGDRLVLGAYELVVRTETAPAAGFGAVPSPFDAGSPFGPAAGPLAPSPAPFGGFGAPAFPSPAPAAPSPFGSFGAPTFQPAEPTPPAPFGGDIAAMFGNAPSQTPAPLGGGVLPEGFDWLLGGGAMPAPTTPVMTPDHVAAQNQFFRPPQVSPQAEPAASPLIPLDWNPLAAGEPPAARPATIAPAGPGAFPAVTTVPPESAEAPPRAAVPPVASPPQAPPQPAFAPGAPAMAPGDAALLRAFLEGASVDPAALAGEDPTEAMRRVGQTFRQMVSGIAEILSTRAMIKTEYRVEQTIIRAADNNPLKFLADPSEAVIALLAKPRPGYMPGHRAVSEGLKDIKVHELALMAAMQAAVVALLAQFEPERLKQHFDKHSILDSLMPGSRKAKYWEIFEQEYRKIAGEVGEDVRGVFHRAFARAYEEQSRKI
jgi:type VI secretion system FHA domain protein